MFRNKTREGRTLMIVSEIPALLLPAHAGGGAGGCERDGGRRSGLVGAGDFERGRAVVQG